MVSRLGTCRDTIHRPLRTSELDQDLDEEPVRDQRAPPWRRATHPELAPCFRPFEFSPGVHKTHRGRPVSPLEASN
jgi:hypothetical protein